MFKCEVIFLSKCMSNCICVFQFTKACIWALGLLMVLQVLEVVALFETIIKIFDQLARVINYGVEDSRERCNSISF